jgi:hypothetical protein
MSQPALTAPLGPDSLFVVACPVCRGHVAASGSLCGRDACCPLCASLFHVPVPVTAETVAESAPAEEPQADEPMLAEDWGGVIGQLAPPAGPEAGTAPAAITPEPADFTFDQPADAATAATELPPAVEPEPPAAAEPLVAVATFPTQQPAAVESPAGALVFQEPVRTVRHGNTVIEIRRLTPEERRTRRFRRNLMMVVVGVSLLLLIVLLAGGFG